MLNSEYLNNLNENQKEATLHLDGPLLIVAGAGSGKTRVLTSRIAHIIKQHKAFPNQILAVTFTNKAAKEMQIRVSKLLRKEATGLPWLGTFHSICAKLLRKHADAVDLKSNFSIIDQADQERLIKEQGITINYTGKSSFDKSTGKQHPFGAIQAVAYRPGWHAGDRPIAAHLAKEKPTKAGFKRVWAKVVFLINLFRF